MVSVPTRHKSFLSTPDGAQPPSEHTHCPCQQPFSSGYLSSSSLIFSPPTESYPCSTCIQPPFGNSPELSFFNSPNHVMWAYIPHPKSLSHLLSSIPNHPPLLNLHQLPLFISPGTRHLYYYNLFTYLILASYGCLTSFHSFITSLLIPPKPSEHQVTSISML